MCVCVPCGKDPDHWTTSESRFESTTQWSRKSGHCSPLTIEKICFVAHEVRIFYLSRRRVITGLQCMQTQTQYHKHAFFLLFPSCCGGTERPEWKLNHGFKESKFTFFQSGAGALNWRGICLEFHCISQDETLTTSQILPLVHHHRWFKKLNSSIRWYNFCVFKPSVIL